MKHFAFFIALVALVNPIVAQNTDASNNFDLRIGIVDNGHFLSYRPSCINYRVEFDYNYTKTVSFGGYLGYAQYQEYSSSDPFFGDVLSRGYFYGINAYYHLTPYLIRNTSPSKFDLYLKGRVGAVTYKATSNQNYTTNFDYGVFLGATYYPFKRFGLNAEIGYGKTHITKLGFTFRLGKMLE